MGIKELINGVKSANEKILKLTPLIDTGLGHNKHVLFFTYQDIFFDDYCILYRDFVKSNLVFITEFDDHFKIEINYFYVKNDNKWHLQIGSIQQSFTCTVDKYTIRDGIKFITNLTPDDLINDIEKLYILLVKREGDLFMENSNGLSTIQLDPFEIKLNDLITQYYPFDDYSIRDIINEE